MDQAGRSQPAKLRDRPPGLVRFIVVADPGIQRLSTADDLIQGAHRFLDRGLRIRPVMIEHIHIVDVHPFQALVDAGDQVFPAAVVAVRAGPHIIPGFR